MSRTYCIIVYGGQERRVGLNEKPLILFKQLDKEGKNPMFMLRKIPSPIPASQSLLRGNLPGGIFVMASLFFLHARLVVMNKLFSIHKR